MRPVSPAARAVQQLVSQGRTVRPGQRVRFLYTLGKPGVRAWDLPCQDRQDGPRGDPRDLPRGGPPDIRMVDVARYRTLLERAASIRWRTNASAKLGAVRVPLRISSRMRAYIWATLMPTM